MKKLSAFLCTIIALCQFQTAFAFDIEWDEYNKIQWRTFEDEKRYYSQKAEELSERPQDYTIETVECESQTWNIAPAVFKVNDAVKPGNVFYLYGDGIIDKNLEVLISPAASQLPSDKPPADAISAKIVQVDEKAKFVAAILPENAKAGTYDVWAKNDYGISQPIRLNEAQPVFFQDYEMAQDMVGTIYGRNMDLAESDGTTQSRIIIENDENIYEMPVISVNPFRIEFWISDNVVPGDYHVYVSVNNGTTWVKQKYDKNEILKIYPKTEDPFNIGLGWANQFNYDTVVNIKDFGAVGDGQADDYPAIQAALDKVHELGGGVVFMPNGTYRLNGNIILHDYTILTGESQDKTKLIYAYDGADKASKIAISNANSSASKGRMGLANFTIENDESIPDYPDFLIWLGNDWASAVKTGDDRTAEYIFFKNLTCIQALTQNYAKGRGNGYLFCVKEHAYIENIRGFGKGGSFVFSYGEFLTVTDSDFYTTVGFLQVMGRFATTTNNYIKRYGGEYWDKGIEGKTGKTTNSQGIFERGPNYVAENTIIHTDIAGDNDGEVICTEPAGGGTALYGKITKATKDTVNFTEIPADKTAALELTGTDRITPKSNSFDLYKQKQHQAWGAYEIVIVKGRGTGQYRLIDPSSFDYEKGVVKLKQDWDIVPDNTSEFIIMVSSDNFYVYKNYSNQGGKGYWFFGDNIDCVIADNIGIEMEGVLLDMRESTFDNQYSICYFARVDRNRFDKASYTEKRICTIAMRLDVTGGYMNDVLMGYGNVIRENILENANETPHTGITETPPMSGINIAHFLGWGIKTEYYQGIKATLIEDCTVKNSLRGLGVGGVGDDSKTGLYPQPVTAYVIVKGCDFEDNPRTIESSPVNNLLFIE